MRSGDHYLVQDRVSPGCIYYEMNGVNHQIRAVELDVMSGSFGDHALPLVERCEILFLHLFPRDAHLLGYVSSGDGGEASFCLDHAKAR